MRSMILNVIDRYIESSEMREYLKNNIAHLRKDQIADIICGARADIKEKYETLKKLAEYEVSDEVNDEVDRYTNMAEYAKQLIDELEAKNGEVFLNNEYCYDEKNHETRLLGAEPALSFQKVYEYVAREYENVSKDMTKTELADMTCWYEVEKYVPYKDDNLNWTKKYIIAANGEVWFGGSGYGDCFSKRYDADFYMSQHLNLPVPFEVGDVITIDCRPFAPVKHGVILKKGDNRDCCCIQCAWISADGRVKAGALKHASVFDEYVNIWVSPLYRAEVFNGELPENEKVLNNIAEYVKANEEKGKELYDFIVYDNDGVIFEKIKEYMMGNVE